MRCANAQILQRTSPSLPTKHLCAKSALHGWGLGRDNGNFRPAAFDAGRKPCGQRCAARLGEAGPEARAVPKGEACDGNADIVVQGFPGVGEPQTRETIMLWISSPVMKTTPAAPLSSRARTTGSIARPSVRTILPETSSADADPVRSTGT